MEVSGQRHAPAALYPGNGSTVPIGQEAGSASELVWTQRLEEKFFAFTGNRTLVVQSVAWVYHSIRQIVQKQEWKVYSLENTEIPDVFFTPRQGR
jgi:hypothetical protein